MRTLLTLLLCGLLTGAAQAQPIDPTRTPMLVEGFVTGGMTEVIFPQGVRFVVMLTIPADQLRRATVQIQPDERARVTIEVDLRKGEVQGVPVAIIAAIWDIPADAPPLLFHPIAYEWLLESVDGQTARYADSFIFTDERARWSRSRDISGRLNVTLPVGTASAAAVQRSLAEIHRLVQAAADTERAYNFMVYNGLFAPTCSREPSGAPIAVAPVSRVTIPCQFAVALSIFRASGFDVVRLPPAQNTLEGLTDYMVRDLFARHWQAKAVPAWFIDGLAQFFYPTSKGDRWQVAISAARSNRLLSAAALAQTSTGDALWRAQSFGLVLYLAELLGYDGLYAFARLDGAASFDTALDNVVRGGITALLSGWRTWLFTDAAESAYGLTPYQPPTRTPTMTRTATATRTPLPSLTPTLLPSRTATPRAVMRPSWTPTPAPPTVTPRPPGSLLEPSATPTAIPVSATPALFTENVGVVIVLVGLGLALIVLIATAGRGRRS